eukprot:427628-Pyramimonas_sp.AAC.1
MCPGTHEGLQTGLKLRDAARCHDEVRQQIVDVHSAYCRVQQKIRGAVRGLDKVVPVTLRSSSRRRTRVNNKKLARTAGANTQDST